MKKKLLYAIALVGAGLLSCGRPATEGWTSPDGTLSVALFCADGGEWMYRLEREGNVLMDSSRMGYCLADGRTLPAADWKMTVGPAASVDTVWRPLWGKRSVVADRYKEWSVCWQSPDGQEGIRELWMDVRLYEDGLAFRYRIPEGQPAQRAEKELTQFRFVNDPTGWFYNGEHANYGPVRLSEVDTLRPANVTLQVDGQVFVNLHEACLAVGAPLVFASRKGESSLSVASSAGVGGELQPGYASAWRTVMVTDRPGGLVDSHLLELLNPDPAPDRDFSWVKPGTAVWDWRINGARWEGFTYTMSYPSWIRMVDFAAAHGIRYLVLDANWYGPEFEKDSDPVKGDKADDVRRLLAYANGKGVGVWLYLNDVGGRKFPIEETLRQYGEWGAAGVKYGFMAGTPEEKNLWTQQITRLCADNHLLVDFHDGPVHPYGQSRTWPNAVTREYCHAQLDAHRVFTPSTFCTSVFVNMVAGPIDMNNGMFDLRQGPTTRVDENTPVPSTLVSEAARTLIVYSGATILPDIPEYYQKYPALLDFLTAEQMPWKESRTLSGQIGEYIVMMRQSAQDVYLVGAATNESARTLTIPLSFLADGTYEAVVVEDGEEAHYLTNRETWKVSTTQVTRADSVCVHLAPGGGACLKLKLIPPSAHRPCQEPSAQE